MKTSKQTTKSKLKKQTKNKKTQSNAAINIIKKNEAEKQLQNIDDESSCAAEDSENVDSYAQFETNVDTSFFYTNDKIINSFDNAEILQKIQNKFPNLTSKNADSVIKKTIIEFLADEMFVQHVLSYYNITIFDLFKILYKQFYSIFKGPYLKKIKKELRYKKYAKNVRRKTEY